MILLTHLREREHELNIFFTFLFFAVAEMDFQWISKYFSQGQIFVSYMFKLWEARLEEAKKVK